MTCDCSMLYDGSQLDRRCKIHAADYSRTVERTKQERDGDWIKALGLALQDLGVLECPTTPDRETLYKILSGLRE